MIIAVIYGGRSGEHEVSLVSAAAIASHIKKDNKVLLIGITKTGKWYLQPESEYERICKDSKAVLTIKEDESQAVSIIPAGGKKAFVAGGKPLNIDVVFPALHGTYGEDGTIQGLFEMADIPYVGCTPLASALTMDKEKTKLIWQSVGLPVVPYVCIKRSVVLDSVVYDAVIEETEKELGYPMFVKPCCAGSSNGASKANDRKELHFAIMEAFNWDDKVLVEKSLNNARETQLPVLQTAMKKMLLLIFPVKLYLIMIFMILMQNIMIRMAQIFWCQLSFLKTISKKSEKQPAPLTRFWMQQDFHELISLLTVIQRLFTSTKSILCLALLQSVCSLKCAMQQA